MNEIQKVETTAYVAGACNIGPQEIAKRRQAGWMGLGLTVVLEAVFLLAGVAAPWRLFLFLPASLGAAGFLQAALRFCAGFGFQGVFNFGSVGGTTGVAEAQARKADRAKAMRIGLYSGLVGAVVAVVGYVTA